MLQLTKLQILSLIFIGFVVISLIFPGNFEGFFGERHLDKDINLSNRKARTKFKNDSNNELHDLYLSAPFISRELGITPINQEQSSSSLISSYCGTLEGFSPIGFGGFDRFDPCGGKLLNEPVGVSNFP